ncbi:hypothetical protein [Paracoccus ravus]|uniref:hypothetical protein n=1 Tax=Paracoccus ravus TaxID=2447760 RepID=UPI001ADA2DBB|nr:hypothetical protein [Paracoccus ravus]
MQTSQSYNDQTARISLQISRNVKKQGKQNNLNRAISFVAPCKPSDFPIFPEPTAVPSASFRPVSASRRFGEAVFRPQLQKAQDEKCTSIEEK